MTLDALLFQALNGLASASGLFFVGAGLSLIFGVTRIVNMAHGSLYMLGIYIAYSIATKVGGGLGFWGSLLVAPLVVAALGALIEITLLRRIYQTPELFQLLATFAVLLVINDATLWIWGNEDLFGPRAPGLRGAVEILRPAGKALFQMLGVFAEFERSIIQERIAAGITRARARRAPGAARHSGGPN